MNTATIELMGIGRVFVDTQNKVVELCVGVTIDGTPVNRRTKKISHAKKHLSEANENDCYYTLTEIKPNIFVLRN